MAVVFYLPTLVSAQPEARFSIEGISKNAGSAVVIVFSEGEQDSFPGDVDKAICQAKVDLTALIGKPVEISCELPAEGTYAAVAYHDVNDNGKLDHSIIGKPKEALGFSGTGNPGFPPPGFDECSFQVAGELSETISITLVKM